MESKKRLLQHCLLLLWCCLAVNAQRKNVLLLFGDDAGFQMGAYNNTAINTPSFDALAAKSVVFTKGYTSVSSCSPSRSALLTGLPQHQNGMYGLANGINHFSTFNGVASLPLILSGNNIRTGIIGKKHVKPDSVYKFDFEATEEMYDIDNIGRNITLIKEKVHQFLAASDSRPFFLYVAFHDPHRCMNGTTFSSAKYGQFCEKMGNGQPGFGSIPDWKPVTYSPLNVTVPYYLPNNYVTRQDLANFYTAYNRMDQGIGLIMKELETAGVLDDTLILYTSDNGIPFPNAKTNLYEPGMGEPMIISNPQQKQHWGTRSEGLASTTDFLPTILDWFNVAYPNASLKLTGKSLLPLTSNPANVTGYDRIFSSHNLHEVTMYYPMRAMRTPRYRLIHNLNYRAPFGMAVDIGSSPTLVDIVNNTNHNLPTSWFKSLKDYYYREQFELFDLQIDPMEIDNLAGDPANSAIFDSLRSELMAWQEVTQDPWRCLPSGILVPGGQCVSAGNSEP